MPSALMMLSINDRKSPIFTEDTSTLADCYRSFAALCVFGVALWQFILRSVDKSVLC